MPEVLLEGKLHKQTIKESPSDEWNDVSLLKLKSA